MEEEAHIAFASLADEANLSYLGLRDQIEILEEKTGRGSRSPEQIERMRHRCKDRHRIALALIELSKHRDELPRWIVSLFEDGLRPEE